MLRVRASSSRSRVRASRRRAHGGEPLRQVGPEAAVGGVQAVDHHSAAARAGGGVEIAPLPQIEGHMAGEKEQVRRGQGVSGNLPHRVALHDFRVPVEGHPVEPPGHKDQPRAVDAQGGLAAPAVLDPQIGPGPFDYPLPQVLRVRGGGSFIIWPQKITPGIPLPAVGQTEGLPALRQLPAQGGREGAPEQGGYPPALHIGAVQHVGGGLEDHPLFPLRPAAAGPGPQNQAGGGGIALIAVIRAHPHPAGAGLLADLQGPAAQDLVGQGGSGAGGGVKGTDGGEGHCVHTNILTFHTNCGTGPRSPVYRTDFVVR